MSSTLLMTAEEAAAELRIGRSRMFDLIREGVIQSVKIGASRRITRSALAAYVATLEADAEAASA